MLVYKSQIIFWNHVHYVYSVIWQILLVIFVWATGSLYMWHNFKGSLIYNGTTDPIRFLCNVLLFNSFYSFIINDTTIVKQLKLENILFRFQLAKDCIWFTYSFKYKPCHHQLYGCLGFNTNYFILVKVQVKGNLWFFPET